jgi:hypothetical protein
VDGTSIQRPCWYRDRQRRCVHLRRRRTVRIPSFLLDAVCTPVARATRRRPAGRGCRSGLHRRRVRELLQLVPCDGVMLDTLPAALDGVYELRVRADTRDRRELPLPRRR